MAITLLASIHEHLSSSAESICLCTNAGDGVSIVTVGAAGLVTATYSGLMSPNPRIVTISVEDCTGKPIGDTYTRAATLKAVLIKKSIGLRNSGLVV